MDEAHEHTVVNEQTLSLGRICWSLDSRQSFHLEGFLFFFSLLFKDDKLQDKQQMQTSAAVLHRPNPHSTWGETSTPGVYFVQQHWNRDQRDTDVPRHPLATWTPSPPPGMCGWRGRAPVHTIFPVRSSSPLLPWCPCSWDEAAQFLWHFGFFNCSRFQRAAFIYRFLVNGIKQKMLFSNFSSLHGRKKHQWDPQAASSLLKIINRFQTISSHDCPCHQLCCELLGIPSVCLKDDYPLLAMHSHPES